MGEASKSDPHVICNPDVNQTDFTKGIICAIRSSFERKFDPRRPALNLLSNIELLRHLKLLLSPTDFLVLFSMLFLLLLLLMLVLNFLRPFHTR